MSAASPVDRIQITQHGADVELSVKVVPGASRTALLGEYNGALRVSVAAPPEDGKANAALEKFLSSELADRKGAATVVAGHSQPLKRVRVAGVTIENVRTRLQAAL